MNKLHPGVKWQFRLGGYIFFLVMGFLIIPFLGMIEKDILISLIIYTFISLIITEISVNLIYKNWEYEFTKEGVKLERGVIFKRYSHIPYERIQNIDIYRGILARILGFSSIKLQTAGYSATNNAEGSIPGVSKKNAEEIRDFILKKIHGTHKNNPGF